MTWYCSFCSKSEYEVERMIAGPDKAGICNECVDLCAEIISGLSAGDLEYKSWFTNEGAR